MWSSTSLVPLNELTCGAVLVWVEGDVCPYVVVGKKKVDSGNAIFRA